MSLLAASTRSSLKLEGRFCRTKGLALLDRGLPIKQKHPEKANTRDLLWSAFLNHGTPSHPLTYRFSIPEPTVTCSFRGHILLCRSFL